MDSLPFIKQIFSQPALRVFLTNNFQDQGFFPVDEFLHNEISPVVIGLREGTEDEKLAHVKSMQHIAYNLGKFLQNTQNGGLKRHNLMKRWKKIQNSFTDEIVSYYYLKQTEAEGELEHRDINAVLNSLDGIKIIEDFLLNKADRSNSLTDKEKSQAVLLVIAFPALCELKEPSKLLNFLFELSKELRNLPDLICEECKGHPMALLLIGRFLLLKEMAYKRWNKVKDELCKARYVARGPMMHIFNFCYDNLPTILRMCFLYLACYPIDYEIPAKSLTELWIAEGFITPDKGETREQTAYKYLEQLVQRSLVCVSKRSLLGTIKYCRVHQFIHKPVIHYARGGGFLAINPDHFGYAERVAFQHDNKGCDMYLSIDIPVSSILAFEFDRNIVFDQHTIGPRLSVLVLGNSTIPDGALREMPQLRYLGLRGNNNISELPENIGDMKKLRTLDVRDTKIETIPESLWKISKLRHVYVNPSSQIKGPPSMANLSNLQILKTVGVHESWLEKFPQFLINLTKLSLINRDNPYWKPISILLSHMVKLLSLAIIGDIIPSEFADTRAFSNLETVKSMKLEGEWSYKKLLIDNIKFPPNLVKLTLTKCGLKEDPIPALQRLQALKCLRLQNGAYIGKKMVCSENGFPQLKFLKLSKLENLEIWEVKPMAMLQLTTLHVLQCRKLINLPGLEQVTDKLINN